MSPVCSPASLAISTAGLTPVARTTWSAGKTSSPTWTAIGPAARVVLDLGDRRGGAHVDALGLGALLDVRGHVLVERDVHDLVGELEDRDLHPALDERLGHLDADVAAADDDRLPAAALERVSKRSAASTVRAGSTASVPGTGGATATAPVAMTSWSNGSVSSVRVAWSRTVSWRASRSMCDDLLADAHVDPALAVLLGASGR